jgi:hypothetical protein
MTDEHHADPASSNDPVPSDEPWEGELQVAHTTVVDDEGDGWRSEYGDHWDIEVYVPVAAGDSPVAIAEVSAFTVRAPESLEEIIEAFDSLEVAGEYEDAITRVDDAVGPFPSLFDAAAEVLDCDDLLVIDELSIDERYRGVPDLLERILRAVRHGPAGRHAAFVLADLDHWQIDVDDEQLQALGLVRWAGTSVVGRVNEDVSEAQMRAAEFIASQVEQAEQLEVGARADDLWLSELIEKAQQAPATRVGFDLPPALPAHVWAGAPEDIHDIDADPTTGAITIETHDATYEVVGAPGTAAQLVGEATEAPPQTQAWLRAVHERWWTYEEALHARVHEAIAEFTEGCLDEVPDELTPHLHMSEIFRDLAPWPLPGEVHLVPLSADEPGADPHLIGQTDPLVFHAVRDEGGEQEHIGIVRLYSNGHVQAWLLDDWMTWLPSHEEAVQALLALGADFFIADVLHQELYDGVVDAILTGDVRGH